MDLADIGVGARRGAGKRDRPGRERVRAARTDVRGPAGRRDDARVRDRPGGSRDGQVPDAVATIPFDLVRSLARMVRTGEIGWPEWDVTRSGLAQVDHLGPQVARERDRMGLVGRLRLEDHGVTRLRVQDTREELQQGDLAVVARGAGGDMQGPGPVLVLLDRVAVRLS